MMRGFRLALLVVAGVAAACAGAPPQPQRRDAPAPPPQAAPRTGLEILVSPVDAEVEIDGVRRGAASALGPGGGGVVALEPGVHRVSVRRPGYATWRAEVAVHSRVERLEVVLVKLQ